MDYILFPNRDVRKYLDDKFHEDAFHNSNFRIMSMRPRRTRIRRLVSFSYQWSAYSLSYRFSSVFSSRSTFNLWTLIIVLPTFRRSSPSKSKNDLSIKLRSVRSDGLSSLKRISSLSLSLFSAITRRRSISALIGFLTCSNVKTELRWIAILQCCKADPYVYQTLPQHSVGGYNLFLCAILDCENFRQSFSYILKQVNRDKF